MNSEKVEIIDSGSALDYGSYTLASYFLDNDVTNSAKNRFKKIDVLNPDERIGEKEKKKKKEEPKTNKVHEQLEEKDKIGEDLADCDSNVKVMVTEADKGIKLMKKSHKNI